MGANDNEFAHNFHKDNICSFLTKKDKYFTINLSNGIFKLINTSDAISGVDKAFAFCSYVTVVFFNTIRDLKISNITIKQLWGYSKTNKTQDYILKKNGYLDGVGLTKTIVLGLDTNMRQQLMVTASKLEYKVAQQIVDTSEGRYFKVNLEAMKECMINSDKLGTIGFFIYCFIVMNEQLQTKGNNTIWAMMAYDYFVNGLGISEGTVNKYLKELLNYGLIRKKKTQLANQSDNSFIKEINHFKACKDISGMLRKKAEIEIAQMMERKRQEKRLKV